MTNSKARARLKATSAPAAVATGTDIDADYDLVRAYVLRRQKELGDDPAGVAAYAALGRLKVLAKADKTFDVMARAHIEQQSAQVATTEKLVREILDEATTLRAQLLERRVALDASVRLQSHYAGLLNAWDGGKRMTFANAEVWLQRLRTLKSGADAVDQGAGQA